MGFQRSRALLLILCLPVLLMMGCGGFKGVVTPTLTSISPATIAAGGAGFTLTANGTNFTSGTKIVWDGVPQATTVVSNTQLTTAVTAAQIASANTITVGVLKADTTSSNVLQLTITGQVRQGAMVTSISPSTVAAGGASFTLTATGTNFANGSMITWNGVATTTTFDSATQLHATISAAQIALPATVNVGVLDPANTLSNELPFTITGTGPTAPPTLASLSPSTVVAGGASFTLSATGTNFVNGSKITWNGVALTSTFVSATQITAAIPASEIAIADDIAVAVLNPDSTISNTLTFAISANPNVSPTLTSITPSSVPVGYGGTQGFAMTLVGTNYESAAVVQITDTTTPTPTNLTPTSATPTALTVQIPATFLTDVGQFQITVHNPGSNRTSNTRPLYVGFDTSTLPASAIYFGEVKDVAWDSINQLFYASVPSDSTKSANKILVINPKSANPSLPKLLLSAPSGGDPDRLAISDDGQFLYVGLDGLGSVARYALPLTSTSTPDLTVSLGVNSTGVAFYALDLQVAPGAPGTIAVARGIKSLINPALGGSVAVYDGTVQRTSVEAGALIGAIQWGASATVLYAADNEGPGGDFYQLDVSSGGVTLRNDNPNYFPSPNIRIHFDAVNGVLYGDDAAVVNPVTATKLASFGANGIMVPDSGLGLAYFLGQSTSQVGTVSYTLQSFDLATAASIKAITLYSIAGAPQHLIRWGTNGLAFSTGKIVNPLNSSISSTGGLYILTGPFVTKTTP